MTELGIVTVMVVLKKYWRLGMTVTSMVEEAYITLLVIWIDTVAIAGVYEGLCVAWLNEDGLPVMSETVKFHCVLPRYLTGLLMPPILIIKGPCTLIRMVLVEEETVKLSTVVTTLLDVMVVDCNCRSVGRFNENLLTAPAVRLYEA